MTSLYIEFAGSDGRARERETSYMGRCVVLSSVKGDEGVGCVSSLSVHVGASSCAFGRESVGPRVRAPPVRGEGVKVLAGWGCVVWSGGSRDVG